MRERGSTTLNGRKAPSRVASDPRRRRVADGRHFPQFPANRHGSYTDATIDENVKRFCSNRNRGGEGPGLPNPDTLPEIVGDGKRLHAMGVHNFAAKQPPACYVEAMKPSVALDADREEIRRIVAANRGRIRASSVPSRIRTTRR
jgi:hypothetical protein